MKIHILNSVGKIALFGLMSCTAITSVHAQQSLNASGAEAKGAGGQVSYSVGQVAYSSIAGVSGSVAQGVQQAYVIEPVSVEEPILGASVKVFPNPALEHLIVQIDSEIELDRAGKLSAIGHLRLSA